MAITLRPYVENIAEVLEDYDQIRLYRDTSPTGEFATLAATVTLVEDQEEYEAEDSSGTAANWYRYSYYDSGTASESELSEAFRPTGLQLLTVRLEAAIRAGAGFASTCSASGTTTELVDAVLRDAGLDEKYLEGAWVYRPDAAQAADRLRRMKPDGFDPDTGGWAPVRAWNEAPAADEAYHVFTLFPPIDQAGVSYSWDRAVRDGLYECWYPDELNLGEGTTTAERRFSLANHVGYLEREHLLDVLLRTTDANGVITDRDASKEGRFWVPIENGRGNLAVELHPAPTTQETVIARVSRRYEALYKDTDVTEAPIELAVRATVWKVFEQLERQQAGKYEHELARAWAAFQQVRDGTPAGSVRGD